MNEFERAIKKRFMEIMDEKWAAKLAEDIGDPDKAKPKGGLSTFLDPPPM